MVTTGTATVLILERQFLLNYSTHLQFCVHHHAAAVSQKIPAVVPLQSSGANVSGEVDGRHVEPSGTTAWEKQIIIAFLSSNTFLLSNNLFDLIFQSEATFHSF